MRLEHASYNQKKKKNFILSRSIPKKISLAELNYDIHDKKLLTIVAAFQKWRVYLKRSKY
jgi:hypothetical protein